MLERIREKNVIFCGLQTIKKKLSSKLFFFFLILFRTKIYKKFNDLSFVDHRNMREDYQEIFYEKHFLLKSQESDQIF